MMRSGANFTLPPVRPPSAKGLQLSLAHLNVAKDRSTAMEDIAWAI